MNRARFFLKVFLFALAFFSYFPCAEAASCATCGSENVKVFVYAWAGGDVWPTSYNVLLNSVFIPNYTEDMEVSLKLDQPIAIEMSTSGVDNTYTSLLVVDLYLTIPSCFNAIEFDGVVYELKEDNEYFEDVGGDPYGDNDIVYRRTSDEFNTLFIDHRIHARGSMNINATHTLRILLGGDETSSSGGSTYSGDPGSLPPTYASYNIPLGMIDEETSAGRLYFAFDDLVESTDAATSSFCSAIIQVDDNSVTDVTYRSSGALTGFISQVGAPDKLMVVKDGWAGENGYDGGSLDPGTFEVISYSEYSGGTPPYTPVGNADELWHFEQVGTEAGGDLQLKVTHVKLPGQAGETSEYEAFERITVTTQEDGTPLATPVKTGWKWISQNGDRTKDLYWKEETEGGEHTPLYRYIAYYDNRSGSPALVSKTRTKLEKFGDNWEETEQYEDPDGENRTTIWTYVSDEQDDDFGLLRSVQYPDGSWEYIHYYNSWGNAVTIYQPWKDVTMAEAVAASGANCKVVNRDYSPLLTDVEYTESVTIEGIEVSRTYEYEDGTTRVYTNSEDYLDTTTVESSYRPTSITYPDGTCTSYVYENGYWDGSSFSLTDPGSAEEAFRKTTKEGTSASPEGIANKTRWRRTVIVDGDSVLEETLLYDGTSSPPVVESITYQTTYDDPEIGWRTETQASLSGRIISEDVYDSDNQLRQSTDESGVIIVYTYDDYGRTATETRAGVTTAYHYDTEGRVEGTTITPEGTATPALSTATTYYPTGEVHTQTDVNGLTSTYSYANSGRTVTLRRPDNSTEITDSYLDGQIKSVTGTGVVASHYDYSVDASTGYFVARESVGSSGSPRWSETVTDWDGRVVEERSPAYSGAEQVTGYEYNSLGQLWKKTRTGLAPILYTYNELGDRLRQGVDLNGNDELDVASAEPISETISEYLLENGVWYSRTIGRSWLANGVGTAADVSIQKTRLNGFSSTTLSEITTTDVYGDDTVVTTTVDRVNATVTQTTDLPDTVLDAVSITIDGRLDSVTDPYIPDGENATTSYTYDELGRQETVTDPLSSTTTFTYYLGTNQIKTVEPAIGAITEYVYREQDETGAGQIESVLTKSADGSETFSEVDYTYDALGRQTGQSGSGTYPVSYGYDPTYGDQTTMTTCRGGVGDTTTWTYQLSTGLLTRKEYADEKGTDYTYYDNGLLATRVWERGITTTYTYDDSGQLDLTDYSDATPDVDWTYNRAGRLIGVTDATGTYTLTYADDGQLATETVSGGLLDGLSLSNTYPSHGNREDLTVSLGTNNLVAQSYGYHASTGRLDTVTDSDPDQPTTTRTMATYAYKPSSSLVESITLNNGTSDVLVRTTQYDALGRVNVVTASDVSENVLNSHDYDYDARGRRRRNDREDGTYWVYGYNDRNEVTSGVKHFADETAIPGFQFGYDFDDIGNRDSISLEGVLYDWDANALNQVSERAVPAVAVVSGTANPQAAIFVNGLAADRHDYYWSVAVTVDNTTASVAEPLTVESLLAPNGPEGEVLVGDPINAGILFVPQTPENFAYDDDGNLMQDGRWSYTWNAENRLVAMETTPAAYNVGAPRQKLEFVYDYQGRRVQKTVSEWDENTSSFIITSTTLYLYDGWNVVAEAITKGAANTAKTYLWGLDLSGSYQGAGGIGGLLAVVVDSGTYYPTCDGNGNVMAYIDASDASSTAQFEYSPFGEPLRASGPIANELTYRFSTKYEDLETALLYYGYRYYSPGLGRWLSKDPIEEQGGYGLYLFVDNDPLHNSDAFGLSSLTEVEEGVVYYTWNLGWMDKSHNGELSLNSGLVDAWASLKNAKAGEFVCFRIRLAQTGKEVVRCYTIKAAAGINERKNQLLWAWKDVQNRFETKQSEWPQSSGWINALYGWLIGQTDKIPSGFSSEDLVSDLVHFYAVVDEVDPSKLTSNYGGRIKSIENEFSILLWKAGHGVFPGYKKWEPHYPDFDKIAQPPYSAYGNLEKYTLHQYIESYQRKFGTPKFPNYFKKYKESKEGVYGKDCE
jgi:RHS repeat-associated protein